LQELRTFKGRDMWAPLTTLYPLCLKPNIQSITMSVREWGHAKLHPMPPAGFEESDLAELNLKFMGHQRYEWLLDLCDSLPYNLTQLTICDIVPYHFETSHDTLTPAVR